MSIRFMKTSNNLTLKDGTQVISTLDYEGPMIKSINGMDRDKLRLLSYFEILNKEPKIFYEGSDPYISRLFKDGELEKCKFDAHIHLGEIPKASSSRSKSFYTTTEEIADVLIKNDLTHACILYSDYAQLEELQALVPFCHLYGLQWIDYDLPPKKLDVGVKPLCKGVKLHSHRYFKGFPRKGYDLDILRKLLNRLPDFSIVLFHLQGNPGSCVIELLPIFNEYPNLKFIMGHGGQTSNPVYDGESSTGDPDANSKWLQHASQYMQALVAARCYSNTMSGTTYMRMSHLAKNILTLSPRFCIESDYPFMKTDSSYFIFNKKGILTFYDEALGVSKWNLGDKDIYNICKTGVNFIENFLNS